MPSDPETEDDRYAHYAARFDPDADDAPTRRPRRCTPQREPETLPDELPLPADAGLSQDEGVALAHTTYRPARFEAAWLLSSLRAFFDEHLVTDVLGSIKGGKEASVYRCAAHPSTGEPFLAAKVYRPKQFRTIRNDQLYRDGRPALTTGVRSALNERGRKVGKLKPGALSKHTAFGAALQHTSWLSYEYATLHTLFEAGAAVPKPFAISDNAILIRYYGDEQRAAPTLIEVGLDAADAQRLLDDTLRTIELMLSHGLIHGDLSAYNILLWQGAITVIDFPQVTSSATNTVAYQILERDIARVCAYFVRQGAKADAERLLDDLWRRYGPTDDTADDAPM